MLLYTTYPILKLFVGIITLIITQKATALPPHVHDINNLRRHLATKTPYIADPKPPVDTIGEHYDVRQFLMVSRHGTRYPSVGDSEDIARIIAHLKTSQNKAAVGWLAAYDNVYPVRRGKELDRNGMREVYDYGHRMARSHPGLIEEILDDDVFLYYSSLASWSKRTAQSAIGFQTGLFEEHHNSLLDIDLLGSGRNNQLFAPLQTLFFENGTSVAQADICSRWKTEVEANPGTMAEANEYKTIHVGKIAARLSRELGITMTTDDVEAVYTGCKFDITHRNRIDTFCTLLAHEDISVLEYRQDLEYYYMYSYGTETNANMACVLIQSVMENMENAVGGKEDYTRMDIKYLHSESVFFVATFLGLYKDDQKLRADW
ncbi:histidine phosphatase superfamily, partial [Zychaea mexicana]|uniref:histidine phosphatase superfamily n=1 Tax=Zychaea mexicana TaxID=64656 RepID=UPI0022FE94AA